MAEDLIRRASVAAKEEVFNHIIIEKHIDSHTDVLHSDKGHRKIQRKKHVLEEISRCSDEGEIARQLVASPCTQQKSQGTLHSSLALWLMQPYLLSILLSRGSFMTLLETKHGDNLQHAALLARRSRVHTFIITGNVSEDCYLPCVG